MFLLLCSCVRNFFKESGHTTKSSPYSHRSLALLSTTNVARFNKDFLIGSTITQSVEASPREAINAMVDCHGEEYRASVKASKNRRRTAAGRIVEGTQPFLHGERACMLLKGDRSHRLRSKYVPIAGVWLVGRFVEGHWGSSSAAARSPSSISFHTIECTFSSDDSQTEVMPGR